MGIKQQTGEEPGELKLQAEEQQIQEAPMVCPTGLEVFPAGQTHCPAHGVELRVHERKELEGQLLSDRYRVVETLTAGGWAGVYRGIDLFTNKDVAIKVLHWHLLSDADTVARFKREAKAAAALSHKYLATVFDAGALPDGQPYIVMELVRGITLSERVASLGELSAEQAIPLFIKVCDALAVAHEQGIIHRDIKPSNLMLANGQDGEIDVKVVDFGLARAMDSCGIEIEQITQTGETLGSPAYMSPEQCLGGKLDARSDIYSLGCTMYEAVTGRPPFSGQSILEYMHRHTYEEPGAVEIRSNEANFGFNMAHVIMQALSKNPEDRQQSIGQLREQLSACMWQPEKQSAEVPVLKTVTTKSGRVVALAPPTPVQNAKTWVATLAPVVLIVILCAVFVFLVKQANKPPEPKAPHAVQNTADTKRIVPRASSATKKQKKRH